MDNKALLKAIENDLKNGHQPFMVVGTAGDVSTGVVDDLNEIAAICKQYNLWFHVDGAYGAPAAVLPEMAADFDGLAEADSIALDPHKWLYSPLEAGCTLVKKPKHLVDTYSSHPDYYHFDAENQEHGTNFYEFGFQNSRGFRALKVWLALKQVGKSGYQEMIREDIELALYFFELAKKHPELEAVTHHLSLTTLRFVSEEKQEEEYLNELNEKLVERLQSHPEMFLSNAIVKSKYCLRGCIVNFRTSRKDIEEIIEIIVREGRKLHMDMSSQRAL
jgi:glutamate/tyrosine decarboxylase-like PLP-dependent enzyme